jgi:hypothetical protein
MPESGQTDTPQAIKAEGEELGTFILIRRIASPPKGETVSSRR